MKLSVAWQPIFELRSGRVVGQEALIRGPKGTQWERPANLFEMARRLGEEKMLELECRRRIFQCLPLIADNQEIFLNVNLTHPGIPLNPDRVPVDPRRVSLEISEQDAILDSREALKQVEEWKGAGYRIVIDDYGSGYASLGVVLQIRPALIKMDRRIIVGLNTDRFRFEIIKTITEMWQSHGVAILAEGVETVEEWEACRECGITYGQGFLLGEPSNSPRMRPPKHLYPDFDLIRSEKRV